LRAFIEAAALTVPTGKRNSFANANPPDGILVEIKDRAIPTNYANAFVIPARPSTDNAGTRDVIADSMMKLDHYINSVVNSYGITSQRRWLTTRPEVPFRSAEAAANLPALLDWTVEIASAKEC
jgi:CRISPR system Cascade subunit CasC